MKKNIKDIAHELGLAPSTISKVVNNNGRVSVATRERVMKHVQASGYVAASNARILKSKRSYTIGVIFSDISQVGLEHPFFSSILQSFKSTVEAEGYEIVFIVNRLGRHELSYLQWCQNKKVDGVLIVMANINNPNIIEVVNSDIPCVSTDIVMPKLHSIISDNDQGIHLILDYIHQRGYKKIGMISGPLSSRGFAERHHQFRAGMAKRQWPITENMIWIAEGFGFNSGYRAAQAYLSQVSTLPDVVLVGSDDLAFGVVRAFEATDIRVPQDVAIIGFDDIPFAALFTPALTTIRQNRAVIGARAAKELLRDIHRRSEKKQIITRVPVSFIERASS